MKIIKSFLAVFLALFLISGLNQDKAQLAAKSENATHHCDHSACEDTIANLQQDLQEATKSCQLCLRIEIEFIPGLFGDWARVSFHSAPIRINAAAAESLHTGDDLCQSMASDLPLAEKVIACRIIVESIDTEA